MPENKKIPRQQAVGHKGSRRPKDLPSDPDKARLIFMEKTGIDPEQDALIREAWQAAAFQIIARNLLVVREYYQSLSDLLSSCNDPPAPDEWALKAYGRERPMDDSEPTDIVGMHQMVNGARENLLETLKAVKIICEDLTHPNDKNGKELEPAWCGGQVRGGQADWGKTYFQRRLGRLWKCERRRKISVAQTALLAIFLGLDEPPCDNGGWRRLQQAWEALIRRDQQRRKAAAEPAEDVNAEASAP